MNTVKGISTMKNLLFIGAVIITMLALAFAHTGRGPMLGSLDIVMFRAINQDMQSPLLNNLAATASDIGSRDIYILFLSIPIILLVSIIRNNRELRKLVMVLVIALLVSILTIYPLKSIFEISRPYFYLNDVNAYCGGKWQKIEEPLSHGDKRNSFPSRHAATTFTVLGILWMHKKLRIPLFIFLFLTSFFIVYVGSHYVSDIIAGGTIGFIIGYLVQKSTMQQLIKNFTS